MNMFYISLLVVLGVLCVTDLCHGGMQEVCNGEEFHGSCPENEVILVKEALYGRMRLGRCVTKDYGELGCQNDVLDLADRWCSGRRECDVHIASTMEDLVQANVACSQDLTPYLEIDYQCVKVPPVHSQCQPGSRVNIHSTTGYISSHVTDKTGCGASNAPWVIPAKPGQIIELWILDFGTHVSEFGNSCGIMYGNVLEREMGVNLTICSSTQRRKLLYKSKGPNLEIHFKRQNLDDDETRGCMIEYNVIGCPDPVSPTNAWVRREGNEAVIGCNSDDDKEWRLHCNDQTWSGLNKINCTKTNNKGVQPDEDTWTTEIPFTSIILLTGVVCGAVLLILMVIVAGMVYIKKQSIKHEMSLKSQYSGATLTPLSYKTSKNPGYDGSTVRSDTTQNPGPDDNQPLVHIWDRFSNKPMTGDTLSHVPNVHGHNTTRSVHDNLLN